jgi:NAD(P)H-hydrate epimerase
MLDRFRSAGGSVRPLESGILEPILESGALVIDGLFGSGLHRPLAGPTAAMIERLNVAPVRVVSLDLPSGLCADDRFVEGAAVRADVTLAMGFLKPAHLFYPAASACGNVAVISVGYPSEALQDGRPLARVLEERGVLRRLPQRIADGHKGTFGNVLVVGGSIGMTGAAILAARGALRAGAGLVKLAAPASLNPVLEASLPEVITIPLPDVDGHLTAASLEGIAEPLRHSDVLAIGPGLSRSDDVVEAVCRILDVFQGPVVIDADALFALSRRRGALPALRGRALLTPHPGEFSSLADIEILAVESDRIAAARGFAKQFGVSLLLKGRPTVIALSDGGIYLNPTGNTGLATGGSGDVLTGVIAGLIAGGATVGDAALVGAYVHGLTAEIYAADRSERSQIPSDIVDLLPKAFREIEQCG